MTRRILVVDDDKLVLRSVQRTLIRAGYTVKVASTLAQARAHGEGEHLHGAVVDYALSRENGLSVLSMLRELQPSCLRILMTGHRDFPVVEAVNRGEVNRVIRKPFESDALVTLLHDAFESARRMEQVTAKRLQAGAEEEREQLRACLEPSQLRLAVQPILQVDGDTATIIAYEALLRPQRAPFDNPSALLQAAERHDRIPELGSLVLQMSATLLGQLPDDVKLFLNLHPWQLGDPARLDADLAPLAHAADRVIVEITERSRLQDIAHWDESIKAITDHGFSVAVDDLGAGYSSLTMLADLNPDYIKLDMSLVRNIHREPRKQRLVHLMQVFADATEAFAIAEGVENEAEAAALASCGIRLMQGYHFARPAFYRP